MCAVCVWGECLRLHSVRAQEAHMDVSSEAGWGRGNKANVCYCVIKYCDCGWSIKKQQKKHQLQIESRLVCPPTYLPACLTGLQVVSSYRWKDLNRSVFDEILKYVGRLNLSQKVSCGF